MNKRIIRITSLALCLCLTLSSCSNKEKQKAEDSKEKSQTEEITNKDGEKEKDKLEKKDGYFTKTCDIISLPTDMDIYQDQNITISFGPNDGYLQSDFSLPIDAPRMLEVNVVE